VTPHRKGIPDTLVIVAMPGQLVVSCMAMGWPECERSDEWYENEDSMRLLSRVARALEAEAVHAPTIAGVFCPEGQAS